MFCLFRFYATVVAVLACLGAPAGAQTAQDLYERAVEARNSKAFDSAVGLLNRALVLEPNNADALVQLGFSHLALGNNDDAETSFNRALEIADGYQDARYGLALIAFRNGNATRAEALLASVLAAQPDNAEARALADRIARAGRAPQPAKPAPARTADLVAVLATEAENLRRQGLLVEAENRYRRALTISPSNTDILVPLGNVVAALGRGEDARRIFNRVLEIAPDYADAKAGLIRVALLDGDIGTAQTLLANLSARERENGDIIVLSGRIALRDGRTRMAEKEFRKALRSDPDNTDALIGLGDALRARGDEKAAREAFESADRVIPGLREVEQRLSAPPERTWRIDTATEYSSLSGGRSDWSDTTVTLSRKIFSDMAITLSGRAAVRGAVTDIQIGARIDRRISRYVSVFGAVALTPDAYFLPDVSASAGVALDIGFPEALPDGLFVDGSVKYDSYSGFSVATVTAGAGYRFSDMLTAYVRWIHSEGGGMTSDGYLARVDLQPMENVRLFAGYSDAPEVTTVTLDDVRTFFAGLSVDVSDQFSISASFTNEKRPTFERQVFGLGLSHRF